MKPCPYAKKCGGCDYQGIPYEKQLELKQAEMNRLLGVFCPVHEITGMDNPYHYRNKVHAVLSRTSQSRTARLRMKRRAKSFAVSAD